jgi:PAS domain S-box-containing protein
MKTPMMAADPPARREFALEDHDVFRQLADRIGRVLYLSNAAGALVAVSPAFERVWGRSADPLIGVPGQWLETIHDEDRQRLAGMVEAKAASGFDQEYRIVCADGSVRWIRDRSLPIVDAWDRVVEIAGIVEDVTERRRVEAHLQQADKMESIGQLAGGVAHDFNNILTVISGNIEVALETLPADHPAQGALAEIQQAASRATALTRQLLSFSRRQVPQTTVVDVNALIADTETMLRRLIGEDILLTTRLDPAVGRLRIDPGHIVQVLMNLSVNARDAMPLGGHLVIETKNLDLRWASALPPQGAEGRGRYVRFTVTDTGCGMSTETRARALEPFFTTKELGKGTGLGLAVVQRIVSEARGRLSIETALNMGTTFQIDLPASEDAATAEVKPRAVGRGSETILYVEDDPGMRTLTTQLLKQNGYQLLVASDGANALELLQREAPAAIDLLLTDVVMPAMNGVELVTRLRELRPSLRVVFTSGYTPGAIRRYGFTEGTLLPKPYSRAELLTAIRDSLDAAPPADAQSGESSGGSGPKTT